LVGPVIGVVILTLLPTAFQFLANYKTLASGVLLVVAMLYFPSGLYGGFTSLVRRVSGGGRPTPKPQPVERAA
jgi:branched-chain amino acid transport system permease protein